MADSQLQTVTILAANGQQSSAIIAHLQSLGPAFSSRFRLRAVIRDPSKYEFPQNTSANATATAGSDGPEQVLEAVAGDMTTVSSLEQAFQGTNVLWAMTNPNPSQGGGGMDYEIQCGKNIVDAFLHSIKEDRGRASTQKPLLLLSSSIDVEAITQGEIRMINATAKAKIESYIHSLRAEDLQKFRFTFVHPGMFMQNFITYQKPLIDDGGVYHFAGAVRADVQLPFVDITDLGPLVWLLIDTAYPAAAFGAVTDSSYAEYDRATIRLWGELLSYPQLIDIFTQTTGKSAKYNHVSIAEFVSSSFGVTQQEVKAHMDARNRKLEDESVATMIADMYNLVNRYGYYGGSKEDDTSDYYASDIRTRKIIPQQPSRRTSWADFVARNFQITDHSSSVTASTFNNSIVAAAAGSEPPHSTDMRAATKALVFLTDWFGYFINGNIKENNNDNNNGPIVDDFEQKILQPYFDPHAVVEFPYMPKAIRQMMKLKPLNPNADEDGALLEGHAEILAYFKDWRSMFSFEEGDLHSMYLLKSNSWSNIPPALFGRPLPASDGGAVVEMRLIGTVTRDGATKPYVQDYVSFAYAGADGKIVRYQEYWAADRF